MSWLVERLLIGLIIPIIDSNFKMFQILTPF